MASKTESKPLFTLPVVLVAAIAIALGGAMWYFERGNAVRPQGPVLTDTAKAYVRNLKLDGVTMKATENAVHQQLVEIEGNITNAGDRHVKSVLLSCVFYDAYGQVVLKERVEIVRARTGGIQPNERKMFRLPFDTLPASWNQGMPQLVIAEIVFG